VTPLDPSFKGRGRRPERKERWEGTGEKGTREEERRRRRMGIALPLFLA